VTFSEVNGENTSDWETIDDSDGTSFTVSDIAPCVVPLDYASFDPYCGNTEYRVVAFNDDTEASGSNIERFTPNFALPSATLDVQATAVAPGSVTVAWSPSSDGSSPVTGYTVHYSTDAADLVCEQNEFGGCDVGGDTVDTTDTAITIDNLDPDTTYYFVVIPTMASTAFGDIPGPVSTNTSVDVPGVVSAPSDVAVSGVTFSSVTVSWTESESNFGPITYTVQISDDGGDTWQDVLDTETPTATIQNLPDGVAYVVQVIARDAYSESEPSDTVEFRLKSRAKPAMPTVTEFSVDSQVGSISFETEDDTGATNVRYEATVYEDFPGGRSLGTVTCDSENLSCEIDGALTGTPYRILMRGFADGGHVQAPWYLHIPAPLEISVDSGVNVQQDDEITVEVTELRPGANAILKVAGRAQTVVGDEDGYASLSFTARGIGQKRVTIKQGSRQASDSVWVVALVTPRVVKPGRPTTLRVKGAKPGSEITLVSSLEDDRLVVASRTGKASFRVTVPTAEDTLDYSVLVDGAEFFSGSLTAQ